MEIVTHVLTSEQHLDDTRKATARKNIAAVSGAKVKGELELLPVDENGIIEIPSDTVVGEGTLTITDGNVVLGQFGANQTTDTAVDIGGKADKVTGAANGNFAGLDANGNITDSGKSVDDFKTKQSPISFSGDTTKTVKNISQNANGELRVEFEDIDLPPEVPNVEITSPNGTIDVHSSTDVQTNTKTFTIDVEQLQAQFPLDISDNIISQKLFVTPEMYGAKGDNTTDDTQAWQSMIADTSDAAKCIILPNNKRYKIDFWNFTLSNRTIIGVNKNNCGIAQKNSNIPFCTIGTHGRLGNITAVIGNNTTATAFINYGLNSSNAFQPFIGSYVHDIHAYCTNKVIGIDFLFPSSGSYNGVIERVKFDAPYDGIRIASTNESTPISTISFITDMAFRDILISDPYHCGYNFYKTQTGGKTISHNTFVNCSVQISRANTYGWILPQMQAVIINPTCFLESGIGNNSAYSMKLDMIKEYPTNFVGGQIHIVGGILEGMIDNKEFLDYITLDNVELVEEPTFGYLDSQERIKRYHNTNDVIKYDLDNYYHNMLNATVTNGSSVLDKSEYGYNLKLSSSSTNTSWTTIDIKLDIHGSISDYITVNSIFSLSNQYTFRLDQSIPFMWVSDGSNSVYSVLGQSRRGSYGKLTMNKEENYYIACDWFNISTLNKDELTLHISIPTLYISNISTDFVRLFGIGVYENYKYKAAELTEIDRISKYDVNCVAVNLVQNFTDAEKAQARANIGATYSIYPSLQDAISDSSNLSVGDIFETNGFYTSGDGGAARYLVSTDLTANDMDIISLGANKQAVLQLESNMVMLEQLGYIPSEDDSNYIEPYINRVLSLPVSTLQLQTGTYFFHTNILIKKNGFTLRGLGSEKTTLKQVSPGLFGLQFEYRELTLEGFTLAGPSDGVGICTRLWTTNDSNVSHYNYTFKNLVVTGFRNGFELGGQVKWQTKFDNVRVSLCYNGISLVESGFCYEFNRVMTDRCENAGLYVFGQADALFNNCNFGSISSGVRIVPWSYGTTENPYYESTLLFNGCNFELDREVSPCPGAFVYVSDGLNVNLNFASCRFTWGIGMKLIGNYGLSLGDQCCIKIDSCEIFVNTDNALVSNFFDPSRNPKKKVGSVIISGNSRCSVKSRMPQWSFPEPLFGSKFKPTLINFSKSGIAHYDDSTNFLQNYGGTSNGTMLYNDSDNCLYTFINGTLCKLTHQQGGANNTIYIYNKLYTFVKIGKLLWLTENLDIPTENSVPITNYGSGQYYPIDDYESLAEYIPLDWRLPTRAECRDSLDIVEGVSPNAKKCCSTAYPSIWPTATNEYGLSMLPNGSSESVDPTRAFWWTSSKGGSDDKTPVYFGVDDVRGVAFSSYTAKIPIRLVRVAT